MYYHSVQFDLKDLEKKIGREYDPLFTHPYYDAIIKLKQQEFDLKSKKNLEAESKTVVKATATGTINLNKSMAHIKERDATPTGFKNNGSEILSFKKLNKKFKLRTPVFPEKLKNGPARQVACGVVHVPDWPRSASAEKTHINSGSKRFLPENDHRNVPSPEGPYNDAELESAQSHCTLKYCPIHTDNVPEALSDDVSSELRGVRYIRK